MGYGGARARIVWSHHVRSFSGSLLDPSHGGTSTVAVRSLILALLVGVSGIYAHRLASNSQTPPGLPVFDGLPKRFDDGWRSVDYPMRENISEVLDADVTLQRVFTHSDGRQVALFLAYFKEQQVNSQIHSPRHCVPGGGWTVASLEQDQLALPTGILQVSKMRLQKDGAVQEMLYWFRTRGGSLTGEYSLKWDLVKNSLAGKPTDALFIRFLAPAGDSASMRELIPRLTQPLDAVLAEVGL